EAGADAVDEAVEIGFGEGFAGEIHGERVLRRRLKYRQPRHVEAEAGVDLLVQSGEFLAEKCADLFRRPDRLRRPDRNPRYHAIDAEQRQFDASRTEPMSLEV